MTPKFDITPEKEAAKSQYLYRQFFVKTPLLAKKDADLTGKTAIVTGSNTGLGLEVARQLLDLGLSKLIIAARNLSKAEAAQKELEARSTGNSNPCQVEVWELDLSSYDSITAFVERTRSLGRLDIAVLNAAVFKIIETFNPSTGFEEDVQVNYLSNALLMALLLPVLKERAGTHPARMVLVSSDTAGWAQFTERTSRPILAAFKQKSQSWSMSESYGTSKLLGQFFLSELAQRVPASAVTVDAVNPGFCYGSELQRDGKGTVAGFIFRIFTRLVGKPLYMGARSIVHAAAGFDQEVHGQYVEDGLIRP
jgi:NAD(P)-dependent dehydrogenase (short-subunit alcohol dehydrogenase family)